MTNKQMRKFEAALRTHLKRTIKEWRPLDRQFQKDPDEHGKIEDEMLRYEGHMQRIEDMVQSILWPKL